jgi:hypothetical protein
MSMPADTQQNNFLQKPLTVGDWILTIIVLSIPIIGFVFLLYWALSSTSNINRKNYCIALLIFALIIAALFIALMFLGVFAGMMGGLGQSI